jgi:hypothetical protein
MALLGEFLFVTSLNSQCPISVSNLSYQE